MTRIVTLVDQSIGVQKKREPREGEGGAVENIDIWTLVIVDRHTREQIHLAFERDTRDDIVRQLTDGIVIAGGGFPKL